MLTFTLTIVCVVIVYAVVVSISIIKEARDKKTARYLQKE